MKEIKCRILQTKAFNKSNNILYNIYFIHCDEKSVLKSFCESIMVYWNESRSIKKLVINYVKTPYMWSFLEYSRAKVVGNEYAYVKLSYRTPSGRGN